MIPDFGEMIIALIVAGIISGIILGVVGFWLFSHLHITMGWAWT